MIEDLSRDKSEIVMASKNDKSAIKIVSANDEPEKLIDVPHDKPTVSVEQEQGQLSEILPEMNVYPAEMRKPQECPEWRQPREFLSIPRRLFSETEDYISTAEHK